MGQGKQDRGFEEVPHTADWEMKVWAPDLAAMFIEAARGMNALAGAHLAKAPHVARRFEHRAADAESMLVAFLSELVYLQEQENLGFAEFKIQLDGMHLSADMRGAPLEALEKPIKAVTYHNMKITRNERRCEVRVVFDV